jgi:hypothetical protein
MQVLRHVGHTSKAVRGRDIMRKSTSVAALALAALLAVLAACGGSSGTASKKKTSGPAEVSPAGDIPDTQVYVPYSPPSAGYTISVPEGWARADLTRGAVFRDKFNSVRIEQTAAPTAPTAASVQADEVPVLRAAGASLIGVVTSVSRNGGNALHVAYSQKSAPDATTGKSVTLAVERFEFWKNGELVTITLSGAKGADNVDPWRKVTDSFTWAL